jgi:type IV pilus biogenesis protein PilP
VAQAQARARQPNAPSGNTVGTGETAAVVAAAAPRAPSIPTSASVARQATVRNAINLNRINLIGVYSSGSQRRALVRLSTGRYVKVKVGDRIDGGRVRSIDKDALTYTKNGRDISIELAG